MGNTYSEVKVRRELLEAIDCASACGCIEISTHIQNLITTTLDGQKYSQIDLIRKNIPLLIIELNACLCLHGSATESKLCRRKCIKHLKNVDKLIGNVYKAVEKLEK